MHANCLHIMYNSTLDLFSLASKMKLIKTFPFVLVLGAQLLFLINLLDIMLNC